MSLAALEKLYAGHEQADIAELVADGIQYRCRIHLSRATWAIEAVCYRIQPDGLTEIFHNIVARAGEVAGHGVAHYSETNESYARHSITSTLVPGAR